MEDLKQQILRATLELAKPFEWKEVFIDMEVEVRGQDREPYIVDSSVAVCFCHIDGEWCDHDLDLAADYRQLFHTLLGTEGLPHATFRLMASSDGSNSWEVSHAIPSRLHGADTAEVDAIIEAKLTLLAKPRLI